MKKPSCSGMLSVLLLAGAVCCMAASAGTYYVDADAGDDMRSGLSPQEAWRTLDKASGVDYGSGDRLLFKRGGVYAGTLALRATGSEAAPVLVDAYGEGGLPVIDGQGCLAAVTLANCSYVQMENLEITADGGGIPKQTRGRQRYGILVTRTGGKGESRQLHLRNLYIHDIFEDKVDENGTGTGIHVETADNGRISDIVVAACRIERTAALGIQLRGSGEGEHAITDIQILDNRFKHIGGPGIQPSRVARLVVRGNVVDGSGSSVDPRMRGRGSGIWPWGSDDVLIEKNAFMHARGIGDSCGMHIDFNCNNVVVQYNLSVDNEGGFVEILGNNHNCAYRYNISVNDGARIKGVNEAFQDGKTLWLSSYTGKEGRRHGPYNSYVYNNTIYVKPEIVSKFSITRATEGALIANNIFYILGDTASVGDDQDKRTLPPGTEVKNVRFENNLYLRANTLPADLPVQDGKPLQDLRELVGDPGFKNPGGVKAEDYVPTNREMVKDKGIRIGPLPGDTVGLVPGLDVATDFFGNPIVGAPDLGAVEIQ